MEVAGSDGSRNRCSVGMGHHMPGVLNQTKVRARQRLVQVLRLFRFDYLVLCSMEDTYWTANVRIGSSELCCRWNKECAFLRGGAQLFGPECQGCRKLVFEPLRD